MPFVQSSSSRPVAARTPCTLQFPLTSNRSDARQREGTMKNPRNSSISTARSPSSQEGAVALDGPCRRAWLPREPTS